MTRVHTYFGIFFYFILFLVYLLPIDSNHIERRKRNRNGDTPVNV
jgi:hypothetical protein